MTPFYLPQVLTGTVTYTPDGNSLPSNQSGVTGALTSSSLSVDFSRQIVNVALNALVNAHTWSASASNIPLINDSFSAATSDNTTPPSTTYSTSITGFTNPSTNSALTVKFDGSTTAVTSGEVQGTLTGNGLNGAALGYVFTAGSEAINGVAAFTGNAQNQASPYRTVFMAQGNVFNNFLGGSSSTNSALTVTNSGTYASASSAGTFDPVLFNYVAGVNVPDSKITVDTNGNVTGFSNDRPAFTTNPSGAGTVISYYPTDFSLNSASIATTGSGGITRPAESGTDATTGITWGRWSVGAGQSIQVTDRLTGTVSTLTNSSSSDPINIHVISSATQTGPVTLPLTGTASYTLVGNTSPTDTHGTVGTLGSATLNADFSNQVVSTSLSVTMPTQNWTASAAKMPIQQGTSFSAYALPSGYSPNSASSPLVVSCSGTGCSTLNYGLVTGAFTGSTGQGAALAYSLNTRDNPLLPTMSNTVSGVAAFKR